MIERTLESWHALLEGRFEGGLDELLAEDCTFFSPIVFTPQRGRDLTKLYLLAALSTFGGDPATESLGPDSTFRYVKETTGDRHAVLEFEVEVDGKYVNGVDIITCNDSGQIAEFKVMIRPLQAVNLLHARMKAMIEMMRG